MEIGSPVALPNSPHRDLPLKLRSIPPSYRIDDLGQLLTYCCKFELIGSTGRSSAMLGTNSANGPSLKPMMKGLGQLPRDGRVLDLLVVHQQKGLTEN